MKFNAFTFCVASFFIVALSGCETDEIRDLAKAQDCLDNVPSSSPGQASSCYKYVDGKDSQQANILKCSIKLTSGGLNTDKIVQAYKVSDNASITNKEAAYVGFLALTTPDRNTGYTIAQEAYPYCVKSEVTGLEFIGGLAKTASMLASLAGNDFDINDPANSATAIGAALEDCVDGTLTCDMADVGNTVASLAESYCQGDPSDGDDGKVCTDINNAIANAGGDPAAAAAHFMCQLQDKTYNGTNACI